MLEPRLVPLEGEGCRPSVEIDDDAPDLGLPRGEDPHPTCADAIWRRRASTDLEGGPARRRACRAVGVAATAGDQSTGNERDQRHHSPEHVLDLLYRRMAA